MNSKDDKISQFTEKSILHRIGSRNKKIPLTISLFRDVVFTAWDLRDHMPLPPNTKKILIIGSWNFKKIHIPQLSSNPSSKNSRVISSLPSPREYPIPSTNLHTAEPYNPTVTSRRAVSITLPSSSVHPSIKPTFEPRTPARHFSTYKNLHITTSVVVHWRIRR